MLPAQKKMHGLRELEHVEKMKQDLLAKVKALGKELPLNTLDELINHFGGPEHVAEVLLTIQSVFWWHWVAGKGASKEGSPWRSATSASLQSEKAVENHRITE